MDRGGARGPVKPPHRSPRWTSMPWHNIETLRHLFAAAAPLSAEPSRHGKMSLSSVPPPQLAGLASHVDKQGRLVMQWHVRKFL
jgi:hypothetical protein